MNIAAVMWTYHITPAATGTVPNARPCRKTSG
jgi:hypothetical protein